MNVRIRASHGRSVTESPRIRMEFVGLNEFFGITYKNVILRLTEKVFDMLVFTCQKLCQKGRLTSYFFAKLNDSRFC